jgi:hypothetical protein
MALLVNNMNCPICGGQINQNQKVIMFPAFISNKLDPLWIFNDSALHIDCFSKHPLSIEAQSRYEEFLKRNSPINRFCVVCKDKIINPDDYFTVGHLTNDIKNELYNYNYMHFHESCLQDWPNLKQFYQLLIVFNESNAWGGEGLNNLLNKLEKYF